MADDIVADAFGELDRVNATMAATEKKKKEDEDPLLWIGGGYDTGAGLPTGATGKRNARLSQLQQEVMAAGAMRTPEYKYYENALIRGKFMSKSYAGKPEFAAKGLEFAAKLYQAYAKKGGDKSFTNWFDEYTRSAPKDDDEGGRYRGPVASVTMANEDDLRRTADALGSELLGRAVSDDEFKKVLKKVRGAEMDQPTVTTSTRGATKTESGISAEGRQSIMRDMLAQNPESQDYLKATKFMDMFNEWLDRRAG